MKKSLAIAAMLTGCQTSTNVQDFPLGPILGGVAGGFIGNQFGQGTGNTVATAVGAVGGVLLGQQLQRPVSPLGQQLQRPVSPLGQQLQRPVSPRHTHGGYVNRAPAHIVVTGCDRYYNPGARAACNRGVADRNREHQRRVERQAYDIGRGYLGR